LRLTCHHPRKDSCCTLGARTAASESKRPRPAEGGLVEAVLWSGKEQRNNTLASGSRYWT